MATQSDLLISIATRDEATRDIKTLQSSIIRLVGAVASLATAFKAITFPLQEAVEFERGLREIQKTTDFTDDAINALGDDLRRLALQTGIVAKELAEIAAAAGQLGLGRQGREAILAFTDTVSRFAVVADLSVEEAARSIARISNIFQIPIDQAERVASAFNELENTTTATADHLIDVVRRVGDAAGLLRFDQVAALAAQALELGQSPEVVATAITKTFSNAQVNAEKFARVLGTTTEEWVTMLQEDALGAIRDVATALSRMGTIEQGTLIRTLFGGGRQFAFGAKLVQDAANNFQILDRTINSATTAFAEATSAQQEYERITNSASRQTDILKAGISEIGIQFGNVLLPVLRNTVEELQGFLQDERVLARINVFARWIRDLATSFIDFVKAIADSEDAFRKFYNIVRLLTAVLLAQIFAGITGRVIQFTARIAILSRVLLTATTNWRTFGSVIRMAMEGLSAAKIHEAMGGFAAVGAQAARFGQQVTRQTAAQVAHQQQINNIIAQRNAMVADAGRRAEAHARRMGWTAGSVAVAGQRARDNAVQGLFVRNADVQQWNNLNTQLSRARSTVVAGTTAFTMFGRAISAAGRTIMSALFGPLGLLISVLSFTLGPAIVSFFRGMNSELDEQGAEALARSRARAAEAQRLIGVFREVAASQPDVSPIRFDPNDINAFSSAITTMTSRLRAYTEAEQGAREERNRNTASLSEAVKRGEELARQIDEQRAALVRLERDAGFGALSGLGADRAIEDAKNNIESLGAQFRSNAEYAELLRSRISLLDDSVIEMGRTARFAGLELSQFLNRAQVRLIQLMRAFNEEKQRLEQAMLDIAKIDVELESDPGRERNEKELKAQQALIDQRYELDQVVQNLRISTSELKAEMDNMADAGVGIPQMFQGLVDGITDVERTSSETAASLTERLSALSSDEDMVDTLQRTYEHMRRLTAQTVLFGRMSVVFNEVTKRARQTAAGIQGVYDNLDITTRAMRQAMVDIRREVAQIGSRQTIEIGVRLDRRRVEREASDLARISQDFYERRIRDAGGEDTNRGRMLAQMRDEAARRFEIERENRDTVAEAESLQRDYSEAVAETTRLQGEAYRVQQALLILQERERQLKREGQKLTMDEVVEGEKLVSQAQLIDRSMRDALEAQRRVTCELAAFEGTTMDMPSLPEELQREIPIITQEMRDTMLSTLESTTESVAGSMAGLVTAARDTGNSLSNAAEEMNIFATAAQTAQSILNTMMASFENGPDLIREMREQMIGLSQDFDSARFAERMREAFRSGPADSIPLTIDTSQIITEVGKLTTEFGKGFEDSAKAIPNFINVSLQNILSTPKEVNVDTGDMSEQIEDMFKNNKFQINLEAGQLTGSTPRAATGGLITGPGTGTSDSIFARLSNGEFVMNALTTRFFGPDFFYRLQAMARNGYKGMKIPRFNAGGLVGMDNVRQSLAPLIRGVQTRDSVDVNLNLGGRTFPLTGERSTVDELTREIRNLSRGSMRF